MGGACSPRQVQSMVPPALGSCQHQLSQTHSLSLLSRAKSGPGVFPYSAGQLHNRDFIMAISTHSQKFWSLTEPIVLFFTFMLSALNWQVSPWLIIKFIIERICCSFLLLGYKYVSTPVYCLFLTANNFHFSNLFSSIR